MFQLPGPGNNHMNHAETMTDISDYYTILACESYGDEYTESVTYLTRK